MIRQMGFANARGSERSQNEPEISTFYKVVPQQGSGSKLLKKKKKNASMLEAYL